MPGPERRDERYSITLDGKRLEISDPLVKGRDVLEAGGLLPVDDYLLFYRMPDGLVADINLSEEVDLRQPGREEFTSIKADRLFYLVVDGRRFPWGKDEISGAELRVLAHIPDSHDVFFDPKGGKDDEIEADEIVSLKGKDTEHFYTEKRSEGPHLVTVNLNGREVQIMSGDYMTETLKDALKVAADLDLDVVRRGSFITLKPNEPITVKAKMKFVSHVRQGGSS